MCWFLSCPSLVLFSLCIPHCAAAGKVLSPGELLTALEGAPLNTIYLDAAGQEKGEHTHSSERVPAAAVQGSGAIQLAQHKDTRCHAWSSDTTCLASALAF